MFKIIIAVLFCCYECMASNDDYEDPFVTGELDRSYRGLKELNDDYDDLFIKGSPRLYNRYLNERNNKSDQLRNFPKDTQKDTQFVLYVEDLIIKVRIEVPAPIREEDSSDYVLEIKPNPKKPSNQSIEICSDYRKLIDENNKEKPTKAPNQKKPVQPSNQKKPKQTEEDVGCLCCQLI